MKGTEERSIIILAIARGMEIKKTERNEKTGKVTFYFEDKPLTELILEWQSNKPLPLTDFRAVMIAETIFNDIIHGK